MDAEGLSGRLAAIVGRALGNPVTVENLVQLPGGASKSTWSFSVQDPRGAERHLVLRADRSRGGRSGLPLEAALLSAAARSGVPVPSVLAAGDDLDDGGAFIVTDFVDGETIPRRILRSEDLESARGFLAAECGRILAGIHRIPPSQVPGLPDAEPLALLRAQLDQLGQPHPAFELALLWLTDARPNPAGTGVVHGDFRNGNLIVGADGIRAVLDWELAHLGDPLEDLGWLCVRAWRFGSPLPVGGFGQIEDLVTAYQDAGGTTVDLAALHWWIVLGTLRWGIICIVQALTHLAGVVRSVELAAIGRRVCEVESDLMELLPWGHLQPLAPTSQADSTFSIGRPSPPHDVPSAGALLDAAHDFIETEAVGATEGRVRFHLRVTANVIAMVRRELELGPAQAVVHAERLARLGVQNDAELASAIRSGAFGDRLAEVADAVRDAVRDKLAVANPGYSEDPSPEG